MSLNIIPVLCDEKNMKNYAYILHSPITSTTIVIDAAEANPILNKLNELNLKPSHILSTHHHFDHVEGNSVLKEKYNLQIIAPADEFDKVPLADIKAKNNTPITINDIQITPIHSPGHTLGHMIYYIKEENALFTGDVLFNLCVGGLFEGTPSQMYSSLANIKTLPKQTIIYPGHEYTRACLTKDLLNNPNFATYLKKMLSREQGTYIFSTLEEELDYNPYLQSQQ